MLITQLQGFKAWELYEPRIKNPESRHIRGKGKGEKNVIKAPELGALMMRVVLGPGDILYVPRGYVHTTSTAPAADSDGHSLHVTVGIETLTHVRLLFAL